MQVGRNRVIEAGKIYHGALDALTAHAVSCYGCHVARRDNLPRSYCSVGWPLAKAATKAYYDLERARGKVAPRDHGTQEALF